MGRSYFWISEKNISTHPFEVFFYQIEYRKSVLKSAFKTHEKAVQFIKEDGYTEYCEKTTRFYKKPY